MAWLILFAAAALEVVWVILLKHTAGFTRLVPSLATLAAMGGSMFLLGLAVRTLPLGTSYAIWTGIGTAGAAIYGIAFLGEPANAMKLVCLVLIVAGVAGLKFSSGQ